MIKPTADPAVLDNLSGMLIHYLRQHYPVIAVAVVRSSTGNHTADTLGGNAITIGPTIAFNVCPTITIQNCSALLATQRIPDPMATPNAPRITC
jgi:hypothetical protein